MRSLWLVLVVLVALVCVSRAKSTDEETTINTIKDRVVSLIRQSAAEKRKARRAAYWRRRKERRRKRRERQRRRWRARQRRRRERRERQRRERERRRKEKKNKDKTKPPTITVQQADPVTLPTIPTTEATTAAPLTIPPVDPATLPPVVPPIVPPIVPPSTPQTGPGNVPAASPAPPGKSSRNPCHTNRRFQGDSQKTCFKYVLPQNLCLACPIRPYKVNGFFNNCANIYDLRSQACRVQLERYVELNPCDGKRRELMQNYNSLDSQMGLDYFVYSICEMCCDCVPMGTRKGTFDSRQAEKTLMKVDRANCPAHAVADICKVWPNVRAVYGESDLGTSAIESDSVLASKPNVCEDMRLWKNKQSQLYKVPEIGITDTMSTFMSDFVDAATCRDRKFWNECVALERSQNRI